jgi:uridylate kinase
MTEQEQTGSNGAEAFGEPASRPKYSRVLLKLGGEMFGGGQVGLDPDVVALVARQIAEVVRTGVQVAVVIGGGNFFRGAQLQQRGMERIALHCKTF